MTAQHDDQAPRPARWARVEQLADRALTWLGAIGFLLLVAVCALSTGVCGLQWLLVVLGWVHR